MLFYMYKDFNQIIRCFLPRYIIYVYHNFCDSTHKFSDQQLHNIILSVHACTCITLSVSYKTFTCVHNVCTQHTFKWLLVCTVYSIMQIVRGGKRLRFSQIGQLPQKLSSQSFSIRYCTNNTTAKVFPQISKRHCYRKSFSP